MLARHRIVEIAETAAFRASSVPDVRSFLDAMEVPGLPSGEQREAQHV
jgi:hypothetical protein